MANVDHGDLITPFLDAVTGMLDNDRATRPRGALPSDTARIIEDLLTELFDETQDDESLPVLH